MRSSPLLSALLLGASILAYPSMCLEIRGVVVEQESGEPLEDTRVVLRCLDGQLGLTQATTTPDGRFALKSRPQERCRIDATMYGYTSSTVFFAMQADVYMTVRMAKLGVIEGRVTDAQGFPLPGAVVVLARSMLGGSALAPLSAKGASVAARTDSQGAYRLYGVPPGAYAAAALASMDAITGEGASGVLIGPSDVRFLAVAGGEEQANVNFSVGAAGKATIMGRVDAAPAQGTVLVSLISRQFPAAPLARTLAGSDGRFQFGGVPTGSFSLFAAAPSNGSGGYAGVLGGDPVLDRLDVELTSEGPHDAQVHLAPPKSAAFQLVGRDGLPDSSCSRSATLLLTCLERWGAHVEHRSQVFADKPVTAGGLAPARYAARVIPLDADCFASGEVVVDFTGTAPPLVRLQVVQGSEMEAKIAPSTKDDKFVLMILPAAENFEDSAVVTVLPNSAGDFSAGPLRPGKYRILTASRRDWSNPMWRPNWSRAVEIQLSSGITTVEIPPPEGQ